MSHPPRVSKWAVKAGTALTPLLWGAAGSRSLSSWPQSVYVRRGGHGAGDGAELAECKPRTYKGLGLISSDT